MAGVSSMAAIFFQDFLANLSGLELHFESYIADSLWAGAVSPLVHSISHFAWWWGCYLLRPTLNGKEDLYYLNNYVTSGRVLKGQVWRWDICPLTLSGLNIGLLLESEGTTHNTSKCLRTWKSLVTELSMQQWRRPLSLSEQYGRDQNGISLTWRSPPNGFLCKGADWNTDTPAFYPE